MQLSKNKKKPYKSHELAQFSLLLSAVFVSLYDTFPKFSDS